jgi:hypothetical protein
LLDKTQALRMLRALTYDLTKEVYRL